MRHYGVSREIRRRGRRKTPGSVTGVLLATAGPPSYLATLHQAVHESFSDEPLLLNSSDAKSIGLMRIIRRLVVDFFESTITDRGQRSLPARSTTDLEFEVLASPRFP